MRIAAITVEQTGDKLRAYGRPQMAPGPRAVLIFGVAQAALGTACCVVIVDWFRVRIQPTDVFIPWLGCALAVLMATVWNEILLLYHGLVSREDGVVRVVGRRTGTPGSVTVVVEKSRYTVAIVDTSGYETPVHSFPWRRDAEDLGRMVAEFVGVTFEVDSDHAYLTVRDTSTVWPPPPRPKSRP